MISFPTTGKRDQEQVTLMSIDDQSIPLRRHLSLFLTRPEVRAEPVLSPDSSNPDSPDYYATHFYGSVIRERDGRFRMWYYALHDPLGNVIGPICYAESSDGLTWTRPRLGQVEFKGNKNNNIIAVPDGITAGVEVICDQDDDDPDPARRYKMAYNVRHPKHEWSVRTAISADGLTWKAGEQMIIDEFVEISSLIHHDGLYIISGQALGRDEAGPRGRNAYSWVSPDFEHWVQARAESVILPTPPGLAGGLWGPWRVQFPQAHLGVAAQSRGSAVVVGLYARWHERGWGLNGTTADLALIVSNDGMRFREPVPGNVFLGSEDSPAPAFQGVRFPTILCQSNGILNVGDKTLIYHGRWRNAGSPPADLKAMYAEIALASIPRDRWGGLGLWPESDDGEVWTAPIALPREPWELRLNADGAKGMRVEIANADFKLLAPFSGDNAGVASENNGLDCAVRFSSGDLSSLCGKAVRMRVLLSRHADVEPRLYAIMLRSK